MCNINLAALAHRIISAPRNVLDFSLVEVELLDHLKGGRLPYFDAVSTRGYVRPC